jgi:hypothetical protein
LPDVTEQGGRWGALPRSPYAKELLMLIALPELDRMPAPARRGVVLTFAGWCCFLFATYAFYDPSSFLKFAIAGGIVCYYLYQSKRWAWVMALLASVFIVLYGGFFAYLFVSRNTFAAVLSVANVLLFAAAFYYLILPESNRYFKKDTPAGTSREDDGKDASDGRNGSP